MWCLIAPWRSYIAQTVCGHLHLAIFKTAWLLPEIGVFMCFSGPEGFLQDIFRGQVWLESLHQNWEWQQKPRVVMDFWRFIWHVTQTRQPRIAFSKRRHWNEKLFEAFCRGIPRLLDNHDPKFPKTDTEVLFSYTCRDGSSFERR